MIDDFWRHFLADAVPAVVMGLIALCGGGAVLLVTLLAGIGIGRRSAWEAVEATQAGYDEQIEKTVPMLSATAEVDR